MWRWGWAEGRSDGPNINYCWGSSTPQLFYCSVVAQRWVKGFLCLDVDAGQHPNVASDFTPGSTALVHTWSELAIGALFQPGSTARAAGDSSLPPPTIITRHLHVHPCSPSAGEQRQLHIQYNQSCKQKHKSSSRGFCVIYQWNVRMRAISTKDIKSVRIHIRLNSSGL